MAREWLTCPMETSMMGNMTVEAGMERYSDTAVFRLLVTHAQESSTHAHNGNRVQWNPS